VTRHVPSIIKDGGFKLEQLNEAYLAPFPKSGSYFFWGVARPNQRALFWLNFWTKIVSFYDGTETASASSDTVVSISSREVVRPRLKRMAHNLMLPRISWSSLGILNCRSFCNWASGAAMHRKITRQSRWNLRRASGKAIPNQAPETGGRRRDWMASTPRG
jgi:hypothetical protein